MKKLKLVSAITRSIIDNSFNWLCRINIIELTSFKADKHMLFSKVMSSNVYKPGPLAMYVPVMMAAITV